MSLTTIGYGDVLPVGEGERWLSVILMQIIGATLYAYVLAVASQLIMHMRRYDFSTEALADEFTDMGEDFGLPEETVIRGRAYCISTGVHRRAKRWMDLLPHLTPDGRNEVLQESFVKYVDHHPALCLMEKEARQLLAGSLEPLLFPAGEMILNGGPCHSGVMFVVSGQCGSPTKPRLTKYGVCGLESVFRSGRENGAIYAYTSCQMMRLSLEDLAGVLRQYPRSAKVVRRWAIKRSFARDVIKVIKTIRPNKAAAPVVPWYQKPVVQTSIETHLRNFEERQYRLLEGYHSLMNCWRESADLATKVRLGLGLWYGLGSGYSMTIGA